MTTPPKPPQLIVLDHDNNSEYRAQSPARSIASSATLSAGSTPTRELKRERPLTPTRPESTHVIDLTDGITNLPSASKTAFIPQSVPVVSIDDDDDESDDNDDASDLQILDRSAFQRSNNHELKGVEDELIDLEELEDQDAEIWQRIPELRNIPVISIDDVFEEDRIVERRSSTRRRFSTIYPQRNQPIKYPLELCNEVTYNDLTLRPHKFVELRSGDFLHIKQIIRNRKTGQVSLRGTSMIRTNRCNGILEKKLNEIYMHIELDVDDPRDPMEQSAIEVDIDEVVVIRLLQKTNQPFPKCTDFESFKTEGQAVARESGRLTNRWKYVCRYASASARNHNVWKDRTLMRLTEEQVLRNLAAADLELRQEWLNGEGVKSTYEEPDKTIMSKAVDVLSSPNSRRNSENPSSQDTLVTNSSGSKRKFEIIDLEPLESKSQKKINIRGTTRHLSKVSINLNQDNWPQRAIQDHNVIVPPTGVSYSSTMISRSRQLRRCGEKLTYGDGFCGAGGTTRGAKMAGLKVLWGFDFGENPCATWRHNFPEAKCFQMHSQQFVSEEKDSQRILVDILHLSPPCQFFSPAHTIDGKDDEMNTASLFAAFEVIKYTRPRIVTLEQTFGICTTKFRYYFNALIHQFSSLSFSVRWAIIPLAHWGLPQRRLRLIIIAACPGEVLPEMPPYVRSQDGEGGLKSFATVNESLQKVVNYLRQPNKFDSSLDTYSLFDSPKTPYDGDKIMPRAMTTSGGQNYHPSGRRDFTLREYAVLQGFPVNSEFRGKAIKKQIGNAVPPIIAKHLFKWIIKTLDEADGITGPQNAIQL